MQKRLTAIIILAGAAIAALARRDAARTDMSKSANPAQQVETPKTTQPQGRTKSGAADIDPGMVVTSPFSGDRGMVVGIPFNGDPGIVRNGSTPPGSTPSPADKRDL